MKLYKEIIEKLLEEVDEDIRIVMLKEEKAWGENDRMYKGYELLGDPCGTILDWQELRDRKKNG